MSWNFILIRPHKIAFIFIFLSEIDVSDNLVVMRSFFLLLFFHGLTGKPKCLHAHSCSLAFISMLLSSTRQQHSSPLRRVDTDCHCLNPKGFTGQLVHWSMKRVPQGQRRRQTAYSWLITQNSLLLNRKVIITRGTGTRSVLIYNEALSGEASKLDPSGSQSYRTDPVEFNANFMQSRLSA